MAVFGWLPISILANFFLRVRNWNPFVLSVGAGRPTGRLLPVAFAARVGHVDEAVFDAVGRRTRVAGAPGWLRSSRRWAAAWGGPSAGLATVGRVALKLIEDSVDGRNTLRNVLLR